MNSQVTGRPSNRSLRDLHFRPIREDDWTRLQCFHRRLSGTTVALRFHGGKKELSTPLAHYFTKLNGHDRVGIVATTGTRGRIVGVARYERMSPTSAEVAFVVEDAYQGHHVGQRLMRRLVTIACENGISEFVADVLWGNLAIMCLLEDAGPTTVKYEHGETVVRVALSCKSPTQVRAGAAEETGETRIGSDATGDREASDLRADSSSHSGGATAGIARSRP